ncbi:hypothetical protein [Chitinophaga silvisoli]|uniref:hypothetical protein n=1 Tax=Chitinophaga silvisoli TaxID=2291814 RepID=UPI0011C0F956|nr:hypothetical protein [Chitinophaga silvisoli]
MYKYNPPHEKLPAAIAVAAPIIKNNYPLLPTCYPPLILNKVVMPIAGVPRRLDRYVVNKEVSLLLTGQSNRNGIGI